ncbi:helix-turn-helix domain-containing protein [Micromonospora chersina]|uniref:helix-turn-helix domain-containing protein n=1 Tax=Micromonospora chersina TaxID=47854 RepID=UPI0033FBE4EA
MIADVGHLERLEQAETLLKPQRIELLQQLAEPRSCTELATTLGQTPQRVYYHVKRLVEQDLVTQVSQRRVHGISHRARPAGAEPRRRSRSSRHWASPARPGSGRTNGRSS